MRILLPCLLLVLAGCNESNDGFRVPGSELSFKTHEFKDPNLLAQAADVSLKREILANSPVLKDLNRQESEVRIALIYKKASEFLSQTTDPAELILYIPSQNKDISVLLARIAHPVSPKIRVRFENAIDRTTLAQLFSRRSNLKYTERDIDPQHFAFQSIERRRTLEIAQSVSGHIVRRLLRKRAEQKGLSLQEYINQQVAENVEISDEELLEHFKKISFSPDDADDHLRDRFKEALLADKKKKLSERYVVEHVLGSPVQVSFSRPQAKLTVNTHFRSIKGYKDAPLSMVVFSGGACTDCRNAVHSIDSVLEEYDGLLRLNWIHTPLEPNGYGGLLSKSALCAELQQRGLSFDFFVRFSGDSGQDDEVIFADWIEDQADGNREDFITCLQKHESSGLMHQHITYARSNGIINNPTVWLEGAMLEGNITAPQLSEEIDRLIAERGIPRWKAWLRKWKARIIDWF